MALRLSALTFWRARGRASVRRSVRQPRLPASDGIGQPVGHRPVRRRRVRRGRAKRHGQPVERLPIRRRCVGLRARQAGDRNGSVIVQHDFAVRANVVQTGVDGPSKIRQWTGLPAPSPGCSRPARGHVGDRSGRRAQPSRRSAMGHGGTVLVDHHPGRRVRRGQGRPGRRRAGLDRAPDVGRRTSRPWPSPEGPFSIQTPQQDWLAVASSGRTSSRA